MAAKRYSPETIIRKLREAVKHEAQKLGHSVQRACRALDVARVTIRYIPKLRGGEPALNAAMTR